MSKDIDKVLYTAKVHTSGGRDGVAKSSDEQLDIKLSSPGSNRPGTNPEQLFAAGWSACFIGAIGVVAPKMGVKVPADTAVDTEVDLGTNEGGYLIQARLKVSLPGLDRDTAQKVVDAAHAACPYSKATRGNINAVVTLA